MTNRPSLPPLSPAATSHIKEAMRERDSNLVHGVIPDPQPAGPKPRWVGFALFVLLVFLAIEGAAALFLGR